MLRKKQTLAVKGKVRQHKGEYPVEWDALRYIAKKLVVLALAGGSKPCSCSQSPGTLLTPGEGSVPAVPPVLLHPKRSCKLQMKI